MSLRTSANRYAKALFDVALEEKADLAQVDRDLEAVVAMMQASPELRARRRIAAGERRRAQVADRSRLEGDDADGAGDQNAGAARAGAAS